MTPAVVPYVAVSDYFLLEDSSADKYEYHEGKVVAMAGASKAHNQIVANLMREVGGFLKGKDCDVFPSDFRVTTPSGNSYFYPDASIVCGPTEMQPGVFDTLVNPIVIIEVMSAGTRRIDKGYKFFFYQQIPSLLEYILIDSEQYTIDIVRKQQDGAWKFAQYLQSHNTIDIESIGMRLSFDDIYYRVLFAQ